MSGLSKLGTGLTLLFVVCLLLLLAEVSYLLWCRRRSRSKNANVESDASGERPTTTTTTTTTTSNSSRSKELLYFFCWKKRSRIEPAAAPIAPTTDQEIDASPELENRLKWHVLFGPSRLLFTIKEEEREDLESERSCSVEQNPNPNIKKRVSLEECFERSQEEPSVEKVSVAVDMEGMQTESEDTPFSTPCASPPYWTPSSSPLRVSGENKGGSFVSLEVHGGRRVDS